MKKFCLTFFISLISCTTVVKKSSLINAMEKGILLLIFLTTIINCTTTVNLRKSSVISKMQKGNHDLLIKKINRDALYYINGLTLDDDFRLEGKEFVRLVKISKKCLRAFKYGKDRYFHNGKLTDQVISLDLSQLETEIQNYKIRLESCSEKYKSLKIANDLF